MEPKLQHGTNDVRVLAAISGSLTTSQLVRCPFTQGPNLTSQSTVVQGTPEDLEREDRSYDPQNPTTGRVCYVTSFHTAHLRLLLTMLRVERKGVSHNARMIKKLQNKPGLTDVLVVQTKAG